MSAHSISIGATPLLGGLAVWLLSFMLGLPPLAGLAAWAARRRSIGGAIHAAGALGWGAAGLGLAWVVSTGGGGTAWRGLIHIDHLSALLIGIVAGISALVAFYSIGYLKIEAARGRVTDRQVRYYYLLYHALVGLMLLVAAVNNLGLMWVAVEATTLVSALLVGFTGTPHAIEAAWKYVILCSVGIALALFGTVLTAAAGGPLVGAHGAGLDWTSLAPVADRLDPALMKVAFVFILIGYGTKAGFAPMHTWLPDAYSEAPSPASALLAGALLNCALYAIIRFHALTAMSVGAAFSSQLLIAFGALSIAVALPFLLAQHDLKRLLAYSSVENVGVIAIGIGLGSPLALFGALFHLLMHACTKTALFLAAGRIVQLYGTKTISQIRGASIAAPASGTLLLLGALAIAGSPPFGTFVGEFSIISASFLSDRSWLGAFILASLVCVFGGLLYHAGRVCLGNAPPLPHQAAGPFSLGSALIPIGLVLGLGLYLPPFIGEALREAVRIIAGGGM